MYFETKSRYVDISSQMSQIINPVNIGLLLQLSAIIGLNEYHSDEYLSFIRNVPKSSHQVAILSG